MDDIPNSLKQFVFAAFETIDHLRIFLLLRDIPNNTYTITQISAKLYLKPEVVMACLAKLAEKGFVTITQGNEPTYQYKPANAELESMADEVARLDRERPVTLINLVYSRPKEPLQAFADAFKLRKEK